jgi:hypothetical protein
VKEEEKKARRQEKEIKMLVFKAQRKNRVRFKLQKGK